MQDSKYTVIIIDDDTLCVENIRRSIIDFPEMEIIGTAQTPNVGKKMILEQRPDLLFLDVEMPEQTGFELLSELSDRITWSMQVVFYTAHQKYLLDALRATAFDFLGKPYKDDDFRLIMNRFFSQAAKENVQVAFRETISHLHPTNCAFLIPTITGYQMLRIEQIGYFEYQKLKKQWIVVLSDQSRLQLKRNTTADNILSYSVRFTQISQHHIINFDYLCSIEHKNCHLLPPFEQVKSLDISRSFLKMLQDKFATM